MRALAPRILCRPWVLPMCVLFLKFCPNARSHLVLSFPPLLSLTYQEDFPVQQCDLVQGRGSATNHKCPFLVLCLESGAFGTTGHETPAFRLHHKSMSTNSGGCIVYGKGPSLHCCSSWMCLLSSVYLTSFGNIIALKPFTPFTSCIST